MSGINIMLNMGFFIARSKNIKHLLVCAVRVDYKHLFDMASTYAKKNPNITVYFVINIEGNYKIKELKEYYNSKPQNLKVIVYPSNRIIEKHLIFFQFILKNPIIKYCGVFNLDSNINRDKVRNFKGVDIRELDGNKIMTINTSLIIRKYLKNHKINQLKCLFN